MRQVVAVAVVSLCANLTALAQQPNASRTPIEWRLVGTWCDITAETVGFELRANGKGGGGSVIVHTIGYDENGNRIVLTEVGAMPEGYNPNGLFHSMFNYRFHIVTAGAGGDYRYRDFMLVLDDINDDAPPFRELFRSVFGSCSPENEYSNGPHRP